jgi:hypothetical protein
LGVDIGEESKDELHISQTFTEHIVYDDDLKRYEISGSPDKVIE